MTSPSGAATSSRVQPTRMQLIARAVRSHQPSASGWPSAIRRGALVGLIVAVGAALGEFPTAATIAVGALNLGLIDPAVPRRLLARALLAVTVITAIIAFVSAGVAGSWWAVPMLMVLAYLTGAIGSMGIVAFNATFMALVTGVLFTNDPGSWQNAAHLALLVLIGSLLQCASTLLAWRYEREAAIRRALVNLGTQMRAFALETQDLSSAHLQAASAQITVEGLLDSAGLSPTREQRFRDLLDEFCWTRLCISNWIGTGHPTDAQRNQVAAALDQVDAGLQSRIGRRDAGTARQDNTAHAAAPISARATEDPAWLTLATQLKVLESATEQFRSHVKGVRDTTAGTIDRTRFNKAATTAIRSTIATMLKPGSAGFRHAVRLALAVGAAEAIALAFSVERGYWIVLTVVMVVKPDFKTTLIRGILRILGTAAAVIVAGVTLNLTSNPQWLMVLLIFIFAPLTMRWITANYAFASFAIGVTVLFLIEAGEPGGSPIWLRLANTLLGAVLGLAAYLILPRWSGDDVRSLLAATIESQKRWTTIVVHGLGGQTYDHAQARSAGETARNAMLAARPAVEAAIIEPHRAQCDAPAALAVLDGCEQAAMATLALEVQVLGNEPADSLQERSAVDGGVGAPQTKPDLKAPSDRLLHYLNADFDRVSALIGSNPDDPAAPSASEQLATKLKHPASAADSSWPDPRSARAVDLLIASADATVSAARNLDTPNLTRS